MNVLNGLNFWYWIVMIICSVVCLVTDLSINPVSVLFMAIVGLLEYINGAIGNHGGEDR